ncbi:hypothetical protein CLF_100921 [Clonorchis sinensis]|uniref:Integrase catalytic domain-containing protein n=1 Tax=Clonorchis sinensis TaxID=79923 RepID=H2KNX4_CLOSI|nr:hypothetical protein CLF_100921 [Clonorchis sinensis]
MTSLRSGIRGQLLEKHLNEFMQVTAARFSVNTIIVIDAYLRWPRVFLTNSSSADFTQQALRKAFSHEGVPTVLVTDNGTHFIAKFLEEWLKGLGCRHLFTVPRHLRSSGLAENFVRTLKSVILSFSPTTFVELDRGIDNFLMQYKNAVHSVTGKSPAFLFKSRSSCTSLDCAKTADITFLKWLLILHKEFLNKLSDCCKQNELFLLTNEDKRGTGKTMLKLKTMDKSWNVRFKITIKDPD